MLSPYQKRRLNNKDWSKDYSKDYKKVRDRSYSVYSPFASGQFQKIDLLLSFDFRPPSLQYKSGEYIQSPPELGDLGGIPHPQPPMQEGKIHSKSPRVGGFRGHSTIHARGLICRCRASCLARFSSVRRSQQ